MNFDAIMLCSYGGPRGMDDVLPFMRNATRGRGIPDERLIQVSKHYQLFDGVSPINERNDELRAELESRLGIPVVIGNRNWTPYFSDTLADLDKRGLHRVLCIFTSAFASYSGCRQYREDIAQALDEIQAQDRFELSKIAPYYTTQGFLDANVSSAYEALKDDVEAHLILVTHSIPVEMDENSGPASGGKTYQKQHEQIGKELCSELSLSLGRTVDLDLAFCSRSGSPHQKWLEPDINDRLEEVAQLGISSVVVLPIGFITDHMEVVFDLDTEAKATAAKLGLRYRRAATAGIDPAFVDSLVECVLEATDDYQLRRAKRFLATEWPSSCSQTCCLPRRDYQTLSTEFNKTEYDLSEVNQ
ncbi:ferrochelatase [Arcanobacterium ihumii]|uniref:ferrochelatase n=1 Tax=Arcanobacterium ihumii TaxID=2138162 RepID=UPI000F522398|nr:ferrochelatase [Arcanobacterium ihumii]